MTDVSNPFHLRLSGHCEKGGRETVRAGGTDACTLNVFAWHDSAHPTLHMNSKWLGISYTNKNCTRSRHPESQQGTSENWWLHREGETVYCRDVSPEDYSCFSRWTYTHACTGSVKGTQWILKEHMKSGGKSSCGVEEKQEEKGCGFICAHEILKQSKTPTVICV